MSEKTKHRVRQFLDYDGGTLASAGMTLLLAVAIRMAGVSVQGWVFVPIVCFFGLGLIVSTLVRQSKWLEEPALWPYRVPETTPVVEPEEIPKTTWDD